MFFICINFFIDNVIAIHNGKNGVNGPNQNAAVTEAITRHQFHLNIKYNKYPNHTGEYITIKTQTKTKIWRKKRNGSSIYETASGGRRTLRSPDPQMEPQDERVHLHGEKRYLYH